MQEFDFEKDYILQDNVALLRPLREKDIPKFLHFATDEPGLWQYSVVPLVGEDGMKAYLGEAIENRWQKKQYTFTVTDKRSGKLAGCTRFYDISLEHKTMLLGYTWYGQQYQRTGLNRHCKLLLLQFAFEQLGMERIEFRADNRNKRSIDAMKALGCTAEGVLRSHMLLANGSRRDSIVLSILKDDWFGGVKQTLSHKTI